MIDTDPHRPETTIVLRHLSGPRRGRVEILDGKTLQVTSADRDEVAVAAPNGEPEQEPLATLHRAGDSYELEMVGEHGVWVNGHRVTDNHMLRPGDLIELGRTGTVLRFRIYPAGVTPKKSMAEALADSIDSARVERHSGIAKVGRIFSRFTHDLATQTTLWFRIWVLVLITALVVSIALLVMENLRLQKRLSSEAVRIEGLATLLEKTGAEAMRKADLIELQKQVENSLAEAVRRVESLEARSDAVARAIAGASGSIAFVQGAYGFEEPAGGKPLRYIETPSGVYLFTLEEEGRIVEFTFTGTAFIVSSEGVLLTNKHIAEPWLLNERLGIAEEYGLEPVIRRMRAFFPGIDESMDVSHLKSSEETDLALLKTNLPRESPAALQLNVDTPQPGAEVLVIGYPLGMSGMLARASPEFTDDLAVGDELSFWTVGDQLAAAGYIRPLASRGIVSQLSDDYIVYDAETAIGGSGGPVLDLDGKVVAVNTAIVRGFGGSNLGVPAVYARQLLSQRVIGD